MRSDLGADFRNAFANGAPGDDAQLRQDVANSAYTALTHGTDGLRNFPIFLAECFELRVWERERIFAGGTRQEPVSFHDFIHKPYPVGLGSSFEVIEKLIAGDAGLVTAWTKATKRPVGRPVVNQERREHRAQEDREFDERRGASSEKTAEARAFRATPYTWRDPRTIPPRAWLYDRHYIRRFVTSTIAPGGLGKSSLALVEAIAMATGRNLLGAVVQRPLRVWYWNGEDPREEVERRVAAILLNYQIDPDELDGRLFLDSGRDTPLVIVERVGERIVVMRPLVAGIVREMREREVDALIVDPFVSCHAVPENDNGAIDKVAKTWGNVADVTGSSVELVHHVRKPGGGQHGGFTVDDARGGSALIGAVRSCRVLNVMTQEQAEGAGIPAEDRRRHFRVDDGKANMQPPMERAVWRKLASVGLGNGTPDAPEDWVGVVTRWEKPDPLANVSVADLRAAQKAVSAGRWRESIQAGNWVGKPIAKALKLDPDNPAHKDKVKGLLKVWIGTGMFVVVEGKDEKRNVRSFVEVGERASD